MNIGFFGDSYVDLIWHRHPEHRPPYENKPWSLRLLEHYKSPFINSGLGGTNQFYAIQSWRDFITSSKTIDYAFFTFTWWHRLYNPRHEIQTILSNWTERRDLGTLNEFESNVINAIDGYYSYLDSSEQSMFLYELQIKWILDLAIQYPEIKFVYLPNTESSREIAKKYFQKGLLLDFAFETISANEGELVGQGKFVENKYGHLTNQNHERFKNQLIDLINRNVYNTIIPINYLDYKL